MNDVETGQPAKKRAGVLENVLEVLWAPSAVFERLRGQGFGTYLLVVSALMLVTVLATKGLLQPYFDAQFEMSMRQAAERGQPMPEGAAMEMAQKIASWGVIIGAVLAPVGSTLITGVLLFLGGKLVRAPMRFREAALVVCLANVPRIFGTIAMAVQGLLVEPGTIRSINDASIGPARFLDPATTSPSVMALLGSLDLFGLWMLVIMAIGASVMARVARGTGAVAAVIAWGVGTALTLAMTLLSG